MNNRKKELKKEYKQSLPPMGVYQIRNLANEKVFVATSVNLPGVFNRDKVQLNAGSHPNKRLQSEWKEYGSDGFVFEVLDELKATEGAGYDYRADLAFLEELWLEKLSPFDDRGYNEKKIDREERLRRIAQSRLENQ